MTVGQASEDVPTPDYVSKRSEECTAASMAELTGQEVSCLSEVLPPILQKLDKLVEEIPPCRVHTSLSPARRLLVLPEILSEIFRMACITHYEPLRSATNHSSEKHWVAYLPRPSVQSTPVKLGRVCGFWRQVVLSTPSIWSGIYIPEHLTVNGLKEWISRAGSSDLTFSVVLRYSADGVLDLLAAHQHRWKTVIFRLPFPLLWTSPRPFLSSLSPHFPNLKILKVLRETEFSDTMSLSICSAPRLQYLCLHAPSFGINISGNDVAKLYRLQEIRIVLEPVSTEEFLSLLRHSPVVESVYINIRHDEHMGSNEETIYLPRLRKFRITGVYRDCSSCPLNRLTLPALAKFGVSIKCSSPATTPHFKSLILRSKSPLAVLQISGNTIPHDEIADCILSLPQMRQLYLDDRSDMNRFIQMLTGPIPPSDAMLSGCICPFLRIISLTREDMTNPISAEVVVRMILSRSNGGKNHLVNVVVPSCKAEVMADSAIKGYISNGLRFE